MAIGDSELEVAPFQSTQLMETVNPPHSGLRGTPTDPDLNPVGRIVGLPLPDIDAWLVVCSLLVHIVPGRLHRVGPVHIGYLCVTYCGRQVASVRAEGDEHFALPDQFTCRKQIRIEGLPMQGQPT